MSARRVVNVKRSLQVQLALTLMRNNHAWQCPGRRWECASPGACGGAL